jgi:hypothetical protein
MNTEQDLSFCDFVEIEQSVYKCLRCLTEVFSEDGCPMLICNIKLMSDMVNARYQICNSCEFFQNFSCTKCGCVISSRTDMSNKLADPKANCPINKW